MNTSHLRLRGSIVALVTPLRDDQVDADAFAALCARQIDRGTSALVPCGTTGEAPLLTADEHRRLIEIAVDTAAGRVPVIAGAGTCTTASSVALARQAEQAGAAALLCVTPYYLRPTQEGVIRHVRAIHDAVGLPIVLYDVPARTACALSDETVRRLAELPRVIGLKDATADLRRPGRLLRLIGDDFTLLSGDDATQADFRLAGGHGCISVTANVAPALCAALHHAWDIADLVTLRRVTQILAPLHAALFLESNPIPVKRALHHLGLIADELRLPLTPLAADADARLRAVLEPVMAAEEQEARRCAAVMPLVWQESPFTGFAA
ncbi:4-hydroxy-tetrahydrodipicolinate synthase [Vineibacter terrae]|uniref:4-hydroxy-tetrahydrodipicolinate synthase n=1 Tax=Vineibacter terrae TaxID=2586908 RepID=UPI002E326779|nr:4-hydroxy-tetrahydrodipicolinate synthase [Vineibacter terrae]HEX2891694.1 4-hydroxy-tetrahydrodipicolinate synthase [Vineibacter terrae]